MKKLLALTLGLMAMALPSLALADTSFHIDFPAFADSLQYMLKGMVGVFLVVGLIILALLGLERLGGKKEEK